MRGRIKNRELGKCLVCHRLLLLNENGLCINCETEALQEKLQMMELKLSSLMKEKNDLYEKLCLERSKYAVQGA